MVENCLPFKIEYTQKSRTIDPESCQAEVLPDQLPTEISQFPSIGLNILSEVQFKPTEKVYGLTHKIPQENPSLDDLLTSVL